jgi:hypothetical protein
VPDRTVDLGRATVAAVYDRTPQALAGLVEAVQGAAAQAFADRFTPRRLADVHATVIGLENRAPGHDVDGLIRFLRGIRLELQFGGFAEDDRRLLSRGRPLYERTVGVQGPQLVLMGWPVDADTPSPRLAELRQACERFGFVHKYHRDGAPPDPDAYLVVGELAAAPADVATFLAAIRERLATGAVRVPVTGADLALVEYADVRLPRATTAWWRWDQLMA